MSKFIKDLEKRETEFITHADNKIITNLENYKLKRPNFYSNLGWKFILITGLILLFIILAFLFIFRNFLKKNIKDDLFISILDIIYILLLTNLCIALFTITNYYYKSDNIGSLGPPGIEGKPGPTGLNKKCDIFKKRINRFKKETIPKNLQMRIKKNFIPPPQDDLSILKNKWLLCLDNKVDTQDYSKVQQYISSYERLLSPTNCLKNQSCQKISNYSPPNNKPINGCIVSIDKLNNIIHAIQFTYSDDHSSNIGNIKLVGMNETCYNLKYPFRDDKDKKNNYDRYISNNIKTTQQFSKDDLDNIYSFHSTRGELLNYTCNVKNFYKQYNIAYISFKKINNNLYTLAGTTVYKNGKETYMDGYGPTILCKSCEFDKDQQRFKNVCNTFNNINACVDNNCVWKNNNQSNCSLYDNNKEACVNYSDICNYNTTNQKCIGIQKCEGENVGNYNIPFTEIESFKAPVGSAIYKIVSYNKIDSDNVPGPLKGLRFYCRNIITGKDVIVQDSNGNDNYYIHFGYNPDTDNNNNMFSSITENSFTAPISSIPSLDKQKVKYYPGFIAATSILYNNLYVVGIEINNCSFYKNS